MWNHHGIHLMQSLKHSGEQPKFDDCVKTDQLKLKRRGAESELNTGEEHETS
jgi:hypothetical protein